jgi:hypothetical protein
MNRNVHIETVIRVVPGFLQYALVRTADGMTTVTMYTDQGGTEASNKQVAERADEGDEVVVLGVWAAVVTARSAVRRATVKPFSGFWKVIRSATPRSSRQSVPELSQSRLPSRWVAMAPSTPLAWPAYHSFPGRKGASTPEPNAAQSARYSDIAYRFYKSTLIEMNMRFGR